MRLPLMRRVFLAACIAATLAGQAAMAADYQGMVVAIVGGDAIRVRDERGRQHTVHLAGLDAPEKFQHYGQRAEDSLRELVFQKYVVVDAANRITIEGRDMSIEQLRRGGAWYDKSRAKTLSDEQREAYRAAEADARLQRVGLWREPKPIPPWEFRAGRRK